MDIVVIVIKLAVGDGVRVCFFSISSFHSRASARVKGYIEEAFLISLPSLLLMRAAVVLIIYATGSLIWPGCGRVRVSIELLPQLNVHGPATHQIMTIASTGVRIVYALTERRSDDSIWPSTKILKSISRE